MHASPLTFRGLKFLKVQVEAEDPSIMKEEAFDFEGAMIGWSVNHGKQEDDGKWWVAGRFFIDNENAKVRCPYLLDIQALGLFNVSDNLKEDKHEKLVYENGAALVYGAIREMVSMVTARSVLGPLMLPTPTFNGTYTKYLAKKETPPQSDIDK